MSLKWKSLSLMLCLPLLVGNCEAQAQQSEPAGDVVIGNISAFSYPVGSGFTKVDMGATEAGAQASGSAWVDAKQGSTSIVLRVSDLPQATQLGAEFLTYVLWTVSPDGTTTNLGEVPLDRSGAGKLEVKSQAQTFAMIVTAEPYYAVSLPSQIIVLKNKNTTGQIYPDNSYKLMQRNQYQQAGNPLALTPDLKKAPLEMYEARNAVNIAKARGAEQYASQVFAQALSSLQLAENALSERSNKNDIISAARQTIQFAEDARSITAKKIIAQRIEEEKEAAAAVAAEKAKSEAEARAALEAKRQAELTEAKEAEMKAQAEAAAAQQKAAAEIAAAQAAATQAQLQAKEEAAEESAAQAKAATVALRAQLLQQLNQVLQTSETSRGLVVHMADVLFELGKYKLSMDAQLKLAKLSGIIQAHPGLNLAIEGYTDNSGAQALNMKLSQQRADATRQSLLTDGLSPTAVSSSGMGEANPIADNSTAIGRQQNRRVEIIVSGKVIGIDIGAAPNSLSAQ